MAMSETMLDFLQPEEAEPQPVLAKWKLAIVDDDQAVHDGTRFALQNFQLGGHRLELHSAYSGREGLELLRAHPDIAVVLLDVVMETEDAGLKLARAIREDLGNELIRIILRTGQPGQAPEHRIVVEYDINDYKAKTELTAERLFTTLTSSVRSYDQLRRLDDTRAGLELIVGAAAELFDDRSLAMLAHGVLIQLNALLGLQSAGLLVMREHGDGEHAVLARIGTFAGEDAEPDYPHLFRQISGSGRAVTVDRRTHVYLRTTGGSELLIILDNASELSPTQGSLVDVFCAKLAVAFENARLHERLRLANVDLEARVARRTAELSDANDRLTAQGAELKRVNAFKNEMLGTIAHDLKNPLAVILGRAEMMTMLSRGLPEDKVPPFAAQIDHLRVAAQRMTRIVDVSLADAMADAMDISINRRRIDLGDVARMVATLSAGLAEAKDQRLLVEIETPLPAYCDPDRMAEAIDNLVSNAVKYAPVGGTVSLSAYASKGRVNVRVADSGPGLTAQDLGRLYGRFQRLTAQPTGGESSTGLGLSIVRKIVELHEGEISVEDQSILGGAAFTLSLTTPTRG